MEDMDRLFKKINNMNIQTRENVRNAHSMAVLGFIAIERIGKLHTYKKQDEILEEVEKYMKNIKEMLGFNDGEK